MKIIYGNNGVGKTKYKKSKQEDGAITLTSDISDWIKEAIDSDETTFEISQNALLISKMEDKFRKLIKDIPKPSGIDKSTFKSFLDKYEFENLKLNSIDFWNLNDFNMLDNEIEINSAQKFINYWEALKWEAISLENRNKLYSIARINDKIRKNKRNIINSINPPDSLEERFNELIRSYEQMKNELLISYAGIQEILESLTVKILDTIFDTESHFSGEEIFLSSLIFYLSQLENKENIVKVAQKIVELRQNRIEISIPENFDIIDGIEIKQVDNNVLIINANNPLSSGQKTLLILKIIIHSSNNDLILDDVLETLDSKNQNIAMQWLFNYDGGEIEILTHDTNIEEIAVSTSNSLSMESPTLLKIVNQMSPPVSHVGSSWTNIIPKIWSHGSERAKFELILCKIFMRYNAKIAVIQNLKGIHTLEEFQRRSDVWSHWKESSLYFFHYHPSIPHENLNAFFPIFEQRNNINTLELIDLLIEKNESFLIEDEVVLSIEKVGILLNELRDEVGNEKKIYDTYQNDCEIHSSWNLNHQKVYNNIALNKGVELPRRRDLIHTLDHSPIEIIK